MRLFIFILLIFQSLNAQIKRDSLKENRLDEVVITATKTERNVMNLPLPMQIITKEDIQNSGLSRLNEIIQEQTGLLSVPDFGGVEGIQIQGLDSAYVMILIDGQPLFGRSAGTLDLNKISINNIERIEILKGASSCLYGSDALAGVVNIIIKENKISGKIKGNIQYKFARFNTHDLGTSVEYGKQKVAMQLSANYFKTNGYNLSKNDFLKTVEPYYNYTINPKLRINLSETFNISINSRFYNQNQENKSVINQQKYIGKIKTNQWNNSILVNHRISNKLKLIYDLYSTNYKANEYLNDSNNQHFTESTFNQWFYRAEIRSQIKLDKNILSAGIGLNHQSLERTYFEQKAKLNSEYIFTQFEWFILQKWNVLIGFRYDNHHEYKSQFSPKLGINYKFNNYFSLKSSIGYGYKAPDLRQLYFDFTNSAIGYTVLGYNVAQEKLKLLEDQQQIAFTNGFDFSNPLKPESSININFGGYYNKNKWTLEYNFFHNTIKNLIEIKAIARKNNGKNVFSYFNIDQIFTYGLELNASYKANKNISISFGYQYLIAKDKAILDQIKTEKIFARNPKTFSSFELKISDYIGLYNRSKHMTNFKINYSIPSVKTNINARVFYRSKYAVFDSNGNDILDKYDDFIKGYFITNISLIKDFKYRISLQIGVNNLLNYKDKDNLSNTSGRQFYFRINHQF